MLYHEQIYWPRKVRKQLPYGEWKLEYTMHALKAARTDRYGSIPLLSLVNLSTVYIFEAEYTTRLDKIVFRVKIDDRDLVIAALVCRNRTLRVKTVWWNKSDDNHATLNYSRYISRSVGG